MSEQTSQRVRRTGSPVSAGSTKQCPLKATMPVSMMRQISNPTKLSNKMSSSSHSPTCNINKTSEGTRLLFRQSPDVSLRLGLSVDRRSPGSAGYKADKTSSLNFKSITSAPCIRRTASLDTIYLAGQWPRDCHYHSYYVRHVMDRATQTDEWEETEKKKGLLRKSPGNGGDQLEMKYFRHKLQRTNKSSHGQGSHSLLQRLSPFQGDHSAISLSTAASSNNGSVCLSLPSTATLPLNNSPYQHLYTIPSYNVSHERSQTGPIPIPHIPKTSIPRILSSVEGLNQEIERLVLKGISGNDAVDMEIERELDPPPDGHRAPIPDLFKSATVTTTRNMDTQTPSGKKRSSSGSGANSYTQALSPTVPFLGQMDSPQPASREGSKSASPDPDWSTKLGTSPRINKFLAREPPDGCERVKIVDEPRNTSAVIEPQKSGPYKPSEKFVLLPSQSSAFCPLYKTYVSPSTSDSALQKLASSTTP